MVQFDGLNAQESESIALVSTKGEFANVSMSLIGTGELILDTDSMLTS